MTMLFDLAALVVLFAVLGGAADLAVKNIKYLATIFKIPLFAFGILLGLITTLPELSVGINAALSQAGSLSVGNILGGIIVIFGLILGASLILSRGVETDGNLKTLLPEIALIFSPILLGWDGRYSLVDGLLMVGFYLALIFYLYRVNRSFRISAPEMIDKHRATRAFLLSITGVILVLLTSHWIVEVALDLLENIGISKLIMGFLVFSIGTNLSEITIAITSWREKAQELSLSHLLSSAFTNVLVLGILASVRPIIFPVGPAFWLLAMFTGAILLLFLVFYHSGKKMDRLEGGALLAVYFLFLIASFYLIN